MATDADTLKTIRQRREYANTEWRDIRDEGDIDMRYVAGDPWDSKARTAREEAGRPTLALDELGQYHNQVINDVLANPRAVKFAPQGNGANDQTSEFYANKMREIEYRSHAQFAYSVAFENALQRSFGWVRVTSDYANDIDDNKELSIEACVNPNNVLPDPDFQKPDFSDGVYLYYIESWDLDEFTDRFPDSQAKSFTPEQKTGATAWFKDRRIDVAEYWEKRKVGQTKRLALKHPAGGAPIWVNEDQINTDELKSEMVVRHRMVDKFQVTKYLTNGLEILEAPTKWQGKYIPFASCLGKVLYVNTSGDTERVILSMTRLARDPYMLYCYYRSCEAELVGMTPKFPYFVYEGQLSPAELTNLQNSLQQPIAVVQVKPNVPGFELPQPLGFPQRQPYEPPIQGLEMGAEAARRAIQAAMGISPLPSQALRHNEKSGVALKQIEQSGQKGSFHFVNHYDDMIRHVGLICEDLMNPTYDTARKTAIREPDEKMSIIDINNPQDPKAIPVQGSHTVTVSSGPAADSQRDAVMDFIGQLMNVPAIAQQCADLIVRLQGRTMNLGPIIDEIANRITPPQYAQPKDGEKPTPEQLQQQLAHAGQENQMLKQGLAKLSQEIQTKKVEAESKERIAQGDRESAERIADIESRRRAETAIAVAEIQSKAKLPELFLEERARIGEQIGDAAQRAQDADEAAADRAHEAGMAALEHAHATAQADQAHDQALEQGAQGVAGSMATQQQAADLAPAPEAEA